MGGNYSALLVTRNISAVVLYLSLHCTLVEKRDKWTKGAEKNQKEWLVSKKAPNPWKITEGNKCRKEG